MRSNPVGWLTCLALVVLSSCRAEPRADVLAGEVMDHAGPVAGAVVRIRTTDVHTTSDADGKFVLPGSFPENPFTITAWMPGYFIAGVQDVSPGASGVEIHLEAHPDRDYPEYAWLPSTYHTGQGENQGCAECHSSAGIPLPLGEGEGVRATLPVDEWLLDAHSQSALNPRFLTLYTGTDVNGYQSPLTRYASSRDYGRFPLRPDPDLPNYGPGYKLDFPETAGNCASCHTPAASVDDPYGVDPTAISGVPAEGVPCDFCHKVWDVKLNQDGMPYINMPGVLSFEFRRPPEGHQFFAGPLDDVAPGEDTFSPLQRQSQFCAPCHFGVFWDTVVYNSFGEWLESPYSDPQAGKTCQDCHMPPLGTTQFARPEVGGETRDPASIFSHRMPGASDEALLQNAVSMTVEAERQGDQLLVTVSITNDQTGHHVPTDSPLRHLILLVQASGSEGEALTQINGPSVPAWGGVGNPTEGYYAGLPGKAFAKVLMELWTEISPSGAYWNPTQVISDNRLAALETDTSVYVFEAPNSGETTVEVRLLFRRVFIELMDQKSWDVPDIVMEEETKRIP